MEPPPIPAKRRTATPLRGVALRGLLSERENNVILQLLGRPSSPQKAAAATHQPVGSALPTQNKTSMSRKRERTLHEGSSDHHDLEEPMLASNTTKRRLLSSPSMDPSLPRADPGETLPLPSPSASPTHQNQIADLAGETDKLLYHPGATPGRPLSATWESAYAYVSHLDPSSPPARALLLALLEKTDTQLLSSLHKALGSALRKDIVTHLPAEIRSKIFAHFDYKTLVRVSEVSRQWNLTTGYSYDLWKSLLLQDKLVTTETELNSEAALVHLARPELNDAQVLKLMYERRMGIKQDWMNPLYQPRVISLDAHSLGVITCLQFDSDKVVAGSDQSKIVIYDTETGARRHELLGHGGGVWAMKYFENTLASGSTDRTVRIWNIAQGRCTHIFKGHVSTVRCLEIVEPVQCGTDEEGRPVFFPEEPLLVTGSRDTTLNVWKLPMTAPDAELPAEPLELEEVDNPYLLKKLEGHTNSVRALSGYCDTIISGSYDNKAIVWDLRTFTKRFELVGHTDRIYSCVYDWKRQQCYTGSVDNTVKIWDLRRGTLKAILEGHQILVGLISASDNVLVSAAADSTVRIWDPNTGASKHVLRGHGSAITCVENDDERIVSGSQGSLILWNAQTGERVRNLGDDITGAVWQVKFDYRRCVAAVQRGTQTVIEIVDFCPQDADRWLTRNSSCQGQVP